MKHNDSGFTFLEILVVMVILTMAFVSAVPKIENFFNSRQANRFNLLDTIISDAYKKSVKTGRAVMIWGVKGSDAIHTGKKTYKLKNEVLSVTINGKNQYGIKYYFFVYPSGIMDNVEILLDNDEKIKSEPLLLRFSSA